jgi:hypothetical protein
LKAAKGSNKTPDAAAAVTVAKVVEDESNDDLLVVRTLYRDSLLYDSK